LARACGRAVVGPPFNLYYDDDYREEDADIETCFPVGEGAALAGCNVRVLSPGRFLSVVHRGPYAELGRSYARLFTEMRERGLEHGRPIREIYRKGPGMLWRGNPRNYVTELLLPIKAS
jgi:effector-binding domain-containing protein